MGLVAQDADLAKHQLTILISQYPNEIEAYMTLAFLYSRELQFEKSLDLLQQIVAKKPELAQAHFNLGYLYQQSGQLDKAIHHLSLSYQFSTAADKQLSGLLLGLCCHQQGNVDIAFEHYLKLAESSQGDPRWLYAMAQAYQTLADFENSALYYQKLRSLVHQSKESTAQLVRFFTTYDNPRWQQLDHKHTLKELLLKYSSKYHDTTFYPKTFDCETEFTEFEKYFSSHPKMPYWIIKPTNHSGGQGMYLVNHPDQVKNKEAMLAQQYIHDPLLVNGFKFNLRLYIVITSHTPLRAYLWNNGITFVATEVFDINKSAMANTAMHIANPLVHLDNKNLHIANCLEDDDKGHLMRLSSLYGLLAKQECNIELLQKNIKKLAKSVLNASKLVGILDNDINTGNNLAYPIKILGLDIVIDKDLQAFLVEVERFPGLTSPPKDIISNAIKSQLLADSYQLCLPNSLDLDNTLTESSLVAEEYRASTPFTLLSAS